ncbi:MAG: tRNA uridine-5-carboxymethylaminomethyl(34) synthesis enzyme MnmG [Firmicutes bacterium]|jgi:tRNA uridine 5-carboxymethylaminomethyl modification enzyme|nr:tRNA uridine-5-carboxymethylaminomethyl(34) synthesis enzyme MnmG [Bacillota bacterium]NLL87369.1 tRNA uridine-5-carboxymethylaminomethyl(34) synthesis enzyme MnmG [Bacillota bacterium]
MYQHSSSGYDLVVVGAGHAGCEAALAAANMGRRVLLLTMNLDNVGLMPCNPSLGGPAKAHLIREIDALGGAMAKIADATLMQMRRLNTRKGPAVQALRAQIDRKLYQRKMKSVLETTPNLYLKEGTVTDLLIKGNRIGGVVIGNTKIKAKAVILATGTYLRSRIFIGEESFPSGPQGQHPAAALGNALEQWLPLVRFKTGTPARINLRSLDYSKMIKQPGNEFLQGFSFATKGLRIEQAPCWLTYTNAKTHQIVRDNLHRAALYTGAITGVGPRYCPSIESKVVEFPDRDRHQVFVEPEGWDTFEGYLSGLSSSLPADVQRELIRTVPGLEHAEIMRIGYAIEYDCLDPTLLNSYLQVKNYEGLFTAGQINGTSGYEEAAAQGLIAGINAALYLREEDLITIDRSQAYIGVLIDDLVIKGTREPYRLMTSHAEYRLNLRVDNADQRLTPLGYKLGLISEGRYREFEQKWEQIYKEIDRLEHYSIGSTKETNQILAEMGTASITHGFTLAELLRRPEIGYQDLGRLAELPELDPQVVEEVEIAIKYRGYLEKQSMAIDRFRKLEHRQLQGIDYAAVPGLSRQAREKLAQFKPMTLGQASRISGVTPADISVLLVYMEGKS